MGWPRRSLLFGLSLLAAGLALPPARADAPTPVPGTTAEPGTKKRVDLLLTDPRLYPREVPTLPGDWSEVRRSINQHFQPSRQMITEDSKPRVLARQLTNVPPPTGGPPGRQLPPDPSTELQESTDAVIRAYEHPHSIRVVELAVTTDPVGRVLGAEVTHSSGNLRFDEAALEAVREAIADRPPSEDRRTVVSRWRIRAGYAVAMPRVLAPAVPRSSNGRVPAAGVGLPSPFWSTFDESTGRSQTHHAFEDKIETEVTLISVSPLLQ